ncbi:MAG: hypothetical protein ACLFT9_13140, partial [Coleofasciculus sp.]
MARLYNGAESPNRCVYCYTSGVRCETIVVKPAPTYLTRQVSSNDVKNQQSTINNQQSTINNQQS